MLLARNVMQSGIHGRGEGGGGGGHDCETASAFQVPIMERGALNQVVVEHQYIFFCKLFKFLGHFGNIIRLCFTNLQIY